MTALRSLALLGIAISLGVSAAPTLEGGPRLTTARPGTAFSGYRSRYAIKADAASARADEAGALSIFDARTGARVNQPLGTFSLRVRDGATEVLAGARSIHFEPIGWTESRSDGALSLDVSVFTLAHDVFAVVAHLGGVSSTLTIEGALSGTLPSGTATVGAGSGQVPLAATINSGEGRAFGVALGAAGTISGQTSADGAAYSASVFQSLSSDGTVAFVLAFHDAPDSAAPLASAALSARGDPSGWLSEARTYWTAFYASHSPSRETSPARAAADERAAAALWHNELGPSGNQVLGATPAKTARAWFEARDSSWHAVAAAEQSTARAWAHVEAELRGQRTGASDPEVGLIPHGQAETGEAPSLGIPTATDAYSEMPALGWALRAIQDRGGKEPDKLGRALDAGLLATAWWRARRDKDQDLVPEVNGSLEAGQEGSARFTEVWGSESAARLPVPAVDPRPRLDAADLASELQHDYVELSRVAGVLGRSEQRELSSRASLLAAQIDEATYGFWDEVRGAYADYTLVGTNRDRQLTHTRAPNMWWPLVVGAARDATRVGRVVEHLLGASEFWRARGVLSLAGFDPAFGASLPWKGALSPEQQYLTMVALYRYGYEAEAEQLRQRLLDLGAGQTEPYEHYDADTGAGLGAAGFGATAAVLLEAARNRHQAETFVLERGGVAKVRQGELRRVFRHMDGAVLMEISAEGTSELPWTKSAPTCSSSPATR